MDVQPPVAATADLPSLDGQARASEIAVALFYALPILMIVAAPWMTRYYHRGGRASCVAFATFALLVDLAMLRSPFTARGPDAVVLSAIVYGCVLPACGARRRSTGRSGALFGRVAAALVVTMTASVAIAGRFASGSTASQGSGRHRTRTKCLERRLQELYASPPLEHFIDQRCALHPSSGCVRS